jgi:valyl-tRNA synthetase
VYEATATYFEELLRLLHPFTPFITEEIWHSLRPRQDDDYIIVSRWPDIQASAGVTGRNKATQNFAEVMELITSIRNNRKLKNIPNREPLTVSFTSADSNSHEPFHSIVAKLCNLSSLSKVESAPAGTVPAVVGKYEYFIHTEGLVDNTQEKIRINQELDYTRSFLDSVMKKLSNERFVSNAKPEVVALEQKKKSDAEERIRLLESQLEMMK